MVAGIALQNLLDCNLRLYPREMIIYTHDFSERFEPYMDDWRKALFIIIAIIILIALIVLVGVLVIQDGESETLDISINESTSTAAVDEPIELEAITETNKNITDYTWDFGDETTETGQSVTHSYSEPGNYKVTLIVEHETGVKNATTEIDVNSIPQYDCSGHEFSSGSGTADDPFLIATIEDLQCVEFNAAHELVNDIDASETEEWLDGYGFQPILLGDALELRDEDGNPVEKEDYDGVDEGVIDGNGYTISNLYIDRPMQDNIGLVNTISYPTTNNNAIVKNLNIEDASVTGGENVGILIGEHRGAVKNVTVEGEVTGDNNVGGVVGSSFDWHHDRYSIIDNVDADVLVTGDSRVGGLIGYSQADKISNAHSTGEITGTLNVGGLIGSSSGTVTTITESSSTSTVTGSEHIGGLIGSTQLTTITESYASAEINGENRVGGVIGYTTRTDVTNVYSHSEVNGGSKVGGVIGEQTTDDILETYATGSITGESNIGGLVGAHTSSGDWSNSYWATDTTGQDNASGSEYAVIDEEYTEGLLSEEMQGNSAERHMDTFGFSETWVVSDGEYPRLDWE